MKCKVITTFKDKHTQQIYKKDEIVDLTEKRVKEILSISNFVEVVEKKSTKKNTKKA